MKYQIKEYPAFKVMGYKTKVLTLNAFTEIPKLWEKAQEEGLIEKILAQHPNNCPAGILGIVSDGQWGANEEMNYIIGMTREVETMNYQAIPMLEGMEEMSYPSATWVVIEANGELPSAVQNVYSTFYNEWLPNSNYELANLPVIESYLGDNHQEVWIAVKNK